MVRELIKFIKRPGKELQTLEAAHSDPHVFTKRIAGTFAALASEDNEVGRESYTSSR